MKTFKYLPLFILLLLSTQEVAAQVSGASESRSGSFYSLFGVGYPTDNNNARELGMGIIGVSLDNSQSNSLQNPALWGKNSLSTASTGISLSRFEATDDITQNVNALLEVGYVQLTLPIYREKLGMSISVYSKSRSNYRFITIDSTAVTPDNTVQYASDIRGAGGINKMEIGFGWNVNKNLALGYAPSFTFVSQNNSQDVFFNQSGYNTSNLDAKITGTAFGHRFGSLLTFRKIFSNKDRITIGAAATLPITIDAEEELSVQKRVNGRDQSVILRTPETGEIKLPLEIKAGITYYPSLLTNISLEGLVEKWSDYRSDFDLQNESLMMKDRFKIGLGGEYMPYRTNSDKFLSQFRYSGGINYDTGHLNMQNEDINTLWFSGGLGIISPRSSSSVDLSVRYGLRGTTTNGLIRENIWSFNLTVNLSELMFFKKRLN